MIGVLLLVAGIALGRVWRSRADFEERLEALEAEADAYRERGVTVSAKDTALRTAERG